MILLIVIPIALILLASLWIRNVSLFKKAYSDPMGILSISVIKSYNTLNSAPNLRLLDVTDKNFFNFTANLILKFVHFVIFAVVSYLCRDIAVIPIILSGIYGAFTAIAWLVYKNRRNYYNSIPANQQSDFIPILKASVSIPIYQSVILILLLFV